MLSKNKKFLAIIPARGGSKRIPQKNIKLLAGKPLLQYTIEVALNCKYIDRVVVSTEDKKIANISKKLGAEVPHLRPKKLATNTAKTLPVLQHMVKYLREKKNYIPGAIITLQPTSPLRTTKHLNEAIKLFLNHPEIDSLVSTVRVPHNFIPECIMEANKKGYLESYIKSKNLPVRSQDKPIYYARNGAIFITKTKKLKQYMCGGKLLNYIMDEKSSIDIDTLEDFKKAEEILKNKL